MFLAFDRLKVAPMQANEQICMQSYTYTKQAKYTLTLHINVLPLQNVT